MNAKRDLLIVIVLLAALGVAWYYTGGSTNDLAGSDPFFSRSEDGSLPLFSIPRVERRSPSSSGTPDEPVDTVTTITNYLGTFDEEESPYAPYVSLEQGNAKSSHGSEYVTIRVASNAPQKVVVTGWRLESTASSLGAALPQAAELPFLGSVNNPGPVALGPGQTAYVVTGRSPNGTSFRTNLCTGYFEQYQDFEPRLKIECPNPQEEADKYFAAGTYSDACYDIVRTLSRCTFTVKSIPISAGSQCADFIQNELSYNGCINRHKNEPKFYKDQWYLYLNRDQELWRTRSERIRLVDENGKVVDVVSY